MFRKIKNRNLFILFLVLAIGVGVLLIVENKRGERNFKSKLVEFDTSAVKGIYVTPRADKSRAISLERVNGSWVVVHNNNDYNADDQQVKEIIQTLIELKPKSLTATKQERWEQYEVTDSLGTRVVVKGEKDKKLADVIIGKFEYLPPQRPQNQMQMQQMRGNQQQGSMQTQVRNADEKEVYLVDGFLNMTFNRQWETYRDKTIIQSHSTNWDKLTYQYPADSSFTLHNDNGAWMIGKREADSAQVAQFLNQLDSQTGNELIDDPVTQTNEPLYSLRIEGSNMSPIEVETFPADTTHQYLIHSNQNNEVYFGDPQGQLVNNIFVSANKFLSTEE